MAGGISVAAVLAVGFGLIHASSYRRRNQSLHIDFAVVGELIVNVAASFSSIICIVLVFSSLYWLMFFRGETTVTSLLPVR